MCLHPEIKAALDAGIAGLWAIVRGDDKDRILKLTRLLQMRDQSTNLHISGLDHAGIDLHRLGLHLLLVRTQTVPSAHACMHGGCFGVFRHKAQSLGALKPILAQLVPTAIKLAGIFLGIFARRLHGDVDGLQGDIGQEWLIVLWPRVQIAQQLIDDHRRRELATGIGGRLIILKPRCLVIKRHIGLIIPIIGPRSIQCERSVKAARAGQLPRPIA